MNNPLVFILTLVDPNEINSRRKLKQKPAVELLKIKSRQRSRHRFHNSGHMNSKTKTLTGRSAIFSENGRIQASGN